MASVVEICNLALSNIRAKSINSLTEGSIEAQQCALKYPIVRDMLLRDTPWQWAQTIQPLALRTEDPLQWVYAYQYPSDCLNLQYVTADFGFKSQDATGLRFRNLRQIVFIEPDKRVPFEIQNIDNNRAVLTDQIEAYAFYTKKITDPNLFDSQFLMALSWYLGAELAVPIMGGDIGMKMRADALQMYTSLIGAAIAANGNEQDRPRRQQSDMITARTT